MTDKQKFIQCDCYGEGLLITKFDGEEELYFSYWRQGIDPIKLSWWMRLKLCWMALTKGNYYEDQVILNKEKAIELASWILLNVVEPVSERARPLDEREMDKTKFATGNLLDGKK